MKAKIKPEDIAWLVLVCVAAGSFVALCSLGGCALLTGDTATKVTQTTVTAAKIAACSQGVLQRFEKLGDKSETAYLLVAAEIAECVREALGPDATPEVQQAAIAAGAAAALEVRRNELTAEQIRQAQDQPIKDEVDKVLK